MATFYLLPPRACLDEAVSGLMSRLLPGLRLPAGTWDAVAERLTPAGVYLVPRDDLPADEPPAVALAAGFGAEPGDCVVEVAAGPAPPRTWVVSEPAAGS